MPDFARELEDLTGIDIHHERPGGAILCLGDAEWEAQSRLNEVMADQGGGYHARMVERAELERMAPGVRFGQEVVGASFSEKDGHCGPLYLLRALHAGFRARGGRYLSGAAGSRSIAAGIPGRDRRRRVRSAESAACGWQRNPASGGARSA